jgi:hypothetical protein
MERSTLPVERWFGTWNLSDFATMHYKVASGIVCEP